LQFVQEHRYKLACWPVAKKELDGLGRGFLLDNHQTFVHSVE